MKRIFRICFFLFWFGFLGLGAYTCIRDKNYGMLLYLSIFWMVGIFAARRKLFGRRTSTNANAGFAFKTIISALLVLMVMLVGMMLLVLGVIRQDGALIFMGFFFILGASAFVIGALAVGKHQIAAKEAKLQYLVGIHRIEAAKLTTDNVCIKFNGQTNFRPYHRLSSYPFIR